MTAREYMAYEWTCDRCGEVETDEVDGIPLGWETFDEAEGGDLCESCAAVVTDQ